MMLCRSSEAFYAAHGGSPTADLWKTARGIRHPKRSIAYGMHAQHEGTENQETGHPLPDEEERVLGAQSGGGQDLNAEDALRLSEARYRELFENIGSGVAVYDVVGDAEDFIFKDLNRSGEKIELEPREALIGQSVFEARPGIEKLGLAEVFRRVWRTGRAEHLPISLYTDDRRSAWYENFVYKLPTGEIVAVFNDVTDRKMAENALRHSERFNRQLFEKSPAALALSRPDGVIVDCNEAYAALLGRSPNELRGLHFSAITPPEYHKQDAEAYLRLLQTGQSSPYEKECIRGDGTRIHVRLWSALVEEEGGDTFVLRSLEDITERVQTRIRLRERMDRIQRQQAAVIRLSTEPAIFSGQLQQAAHIILDVAGETLDVSRAGLWLYGPDRKQLQCITCVNAEGDPLDNLLSLNIDLFPAYRDALEHNPVLAVSNTDHDPQTAELRDPYLAPRGIVALLSAPIRVSGNVAGILQFEHTETSRSWHDDEILFAATAAEQVALTLMHKARTQAETALRDSEARNRALLNAIPDTIFIATQNGILLDCHAPDPHPFSCPPAETIGKNCHDVFPRELADGIADRIEIACQQGHMQLFEYAARLHGQPREFEARFVPCGHDRALGIVRDITERKQAQATLHEYQARLQALLDHSRAAIYIKDLDRRFLIVNQAFAALVGLPPESIVNYKDEDIFNLDDAATLRENDQKVLDDGTALETEETVCLPDGPRTFMSMKFPLRDQAGRVYALGGISTDITARKQAEEEHKRLEAKVQQAQKLESLGILAGGVAHDFNNLLTGILGNADLALYAIPAHLPERAHLEEIIAAARQAAALCQQMLAYSGKGKTREEAVNLNEITQEMLRLLEASISKKARLHCQFEADLPLTLGDPAQLRQVIMNLITNASEALEDQEGDIFLTTGAMRLDPENASEFLLAESIFPGEFVYIDVADTGCGMSEQTIARVFDPFFTTKFTGRGLGLAAALGIVHSHHGAIRVKGAPGQGSAFRLALPAVAHPATSLSSNRFAWPARRGNGAILVVDDEDMVREVARKILEREGFNAVTARDGKEAVALFRERPDAFDLVVLDMAMPHMNGEETLIELQRIRPDVRVLLSSGYDESRVAGRLSQNGVMGFLQKPYKVAFFLETIYRALGR